MKKSIYVLIMALMVGIGAKVEGAVWQLASGDLSGSSAYANASFADGDIIELTNAAGTYTWTTKVTALTKSLTIRAAAGLATRPVVVLPTGVMLASNGNTTPITVSFEGIEFDGNSVATGITSAKSNNASPNTGDFTLSINNCYFRSMGAVGPSIGLFAYSATGHTGAYSGLNITNSIFDGMAYVIYGGGTNGNPNSITLNNCYFSNITNKAINAQTATAGGVTIDHCTFDNCASVASSAEVLIKASVATPTIMKNTLFANRNATSTTANTFGVAVSGSPNTNNAYYQSTPTASIYPATITGSSAVAAITSNPTIVDRIATGAAYLTGASDGAVIGYKGYSATTPTITKSVSSINSGMGYAVGGSSTAQTFTVEGTNMTAGILVAAPTNFEVSSNNTTFVDSYTVGAAGTISATTVYVRAKSGLNAATYTGDINLTSTGATAKTVSLQAIVTGPIITRSVATLTGLNYGVGFGPSAAQSFTVTSSGLSVDITVTAPTNYEVSLSSGSGFASSVNVTKNGTNTPVYVRQVTGLAIGSYSGDISLASTDASTVTVAVSGSVGSPIVKVGTSAGADNKLSLAAQTTTYAAPSSSLSGMYVSGDYLQGDVTVTAPTGFEVSKDDVTFSDFVTFTVSNQTVSGQVWNRLKAGLNTDSYSGNIVYSSTGAANRTVAASGSVTGGTQLTLGGLSGISSDLNYLYNGQSTGRSFTITSASLSADVTVTPPTNFEISTTSGSGFTSSPIAIAQATAAAGAQTIYVRTKSGLALGTYTESIVVSTTGANNKSVVVSGTVYLTPTVTVTPIGTYTYNGSPQGPIAATNTGTGSVYTFSYVGTGTTIYTASATRPTELGTYSVTATVAAHGNYIQASSAATAFNITTETVNTGGNISDIVLTDPELANTNITVSSGELIIDATKTVRSITVNSGAKLTIPTGQTLTLTNFTLKSDASGTSTYKPVGTGALVVTGTTNVEQYLANTRNYYVSSPVSNAVAPAGYTYYGRNETLSNLGWVAVSVGAGLTAGKGYIALPGTGDAPITFTTQSGGTLNTGTIPVSLTYTLAATSGKGYNLIGNPYPSHLNWTKAFTDANVAKIEPSIWYRTKVGNGNSTGWSFKTYNAFTGDAVPLGTTGIIPPMQGFWVLAKQTTTIDFTDDMRSHETGNPLKAPAANNVDRKKVRLQVSNGTRADEALLVFDANASDNYDSYDSPKMMNNATDIADIYTVADAKKLVINGMSNVKYDTEIPIGFSTVSAGDFSISTSEFSNFEVGTRLILLDKNYPTIETELTPETAYHFSAPVTTASTNRFSLLFRAPGNATGLNNTEKLHAQVFVNAANQITIIAPEKCNYAIYNAVGQLMENGATTSNYQTSNAKLNAGVYVVKVGNETTRVIVK